MLWIVKSIEATGNELAEVKLDTGKYNQPGYGRMCILVPRADAIFYPLGHAYNSGDLTPVEGQV